MTNADSSYDQFLNLLSNKNISFDESTSMVSDTYKLIEVNSFDWEKLNTLSSKFGYRWVAIWACHIGEKIQITSCYEKNGDYLLARAKINADYPEIASSTLIYPAANRAERYTHDMFGVEFLNHTSLCRWTRHQAWNEKEFPLRKDFSKSVNDTKGTPPDLDYPFLRINGSCVCEVPVGPVHAGIIEPGHFRFSVAGENVLNLEERLGYAHKGIEKLAEGRDVLGLIRLAGRISGDSTVAHTWATCQACENAANIKIPGRALFIRAIMAERERIANHLGDIGAICNDVGFAFAHYQYGRLRELWQRINAEVFGHRFMMDCMVYGGVKIDLSPTDVKKILEQVCLFQKEANEVFDIIKNNNSLQDRLKTTGILTPEIAKKIGALGYVGKASGCDYDLRRDVAYLPYKKTNISSPVLTDGDVASRVNIRHEEVLISLELLADFLTKIAPGKIITEELPPKSVEGLGLIEGWRGEILTYVRFDSKGRVDRFFPRDPSWLNWPALEHLIHGNIIPDFPVCNKSINGSYSGHDL